MLHVTTCSKIYFAPLLTLISPIISVFVPIIGMKWYGLEISYATCLKFVWTGLIYQIKTALITIMKGTSPLIILLTILYISFYFYGIWTTIQISLEKYAVLKEIRERINNLKNFLLDLRDIILDNRNKYFKDKTIFLEIDSFLNEMQSESILTNIGKDLVIFRKFFRPTNDDQKILERIIGYARQISGTLCLARLLRISGYCLPSWYKNETPIIDVKKLSHPSIPNKLAVTNDIYLNKNLLITGPNQAGKSTFMRSLLLSVWMAQTIGVVRAVSYDATPFQLIYSYIGLTDEIGKESLFQAEMNAVYEYLEKINNDKKLNSICFFDELFTSTNYEEGVSAAIAVGEVLEKIPNSITVIASHFTELGKLQFDKVYLDINEETTGKLQFTYKVKSGLSHHRVALRLMKEKGYNPILVRKAYANLENLFTKTTEFVKGLETRNLEKVSDKQVNNQISNPVSNQISNPVSNPISNQISNPVSNQISNPVSNQIINQISDPVSNPINNPINNPVSNQLNKQINNPISNQISNQLNKQISNPVSNPVSNQVSNQISNPVSKAVKEGVIEQKYRQVLPDLYQ